MSQPLNCISPNHMVTPKEGVIAFFQSIDKVARVRRLLSQMNIKVTQYQTDKWIRENSMPIFIYDALLTVKDDRDSKKNRADGADIGAVEVFIDDKLVGIFELPRNVKICLVKRRSL